MGAINDLARADVIGTHMFRLTMPPIKSLLVSSHAIQAKGITMCPANATAPYPKKPPKCCTKADMDVFGPTRNSCSGRANPPPPPPSLLRRIGVD